MITGTVDGEAFEGLSIFFTIDANKGDDFPREVLSLGLHDAKGHLPDAIRALLRCGVAVLAIIGFVMAEQADLEEDLLGPPRPRGTTEDSQGVFSAKTWRRGRDSNPRRRF